MCDAPPHRKKSTVDLAGFASVGSETDGAVVALAPPLKPSDAKPAVEAVKKARRSIEGRKSGVCMARVASSYAGKGADCHETADSRSKLDDVVNCVGSGLDFLVSWNFKHLVNVQREAGFNAVNLLQGYPPVRIINPLQLIYGNNTESI